MIRFMEDAESQKNRLLDALHNALKARASAHDQYGPDSVEWMVCNNEVAKAKNAYLEATRAKD